MSENKSPDTFSYLSPIARTNESVARARAGCIGIAKYDFSKISSPQSDLFNMFKISKEQVAVAKAEIVKKCKTLRLAPAILPDTGGERKT